MYKKFFGYFLLLTVFCSVLFISAFAEYDEIMIGDHVLFGSMEIDGNTDNG